MSYLSKLTVKSVTRSSVKDPAIMRRQKLVAGNGNAVLVKALKDVQGALEGLKGAAEAGELDEAVDDVAKRTKA